MTDKLADAFDVTLPAKPYPGLRPFEKHEWAIFFGRETMTDEVIRRLYTEQLLVVHGESGCGKSSLIRAGVLPRLEQENARGGINWRTAIAQPNDAPLRNLAKALAGLDGRENDPEQLTQIRRVLNYGKDAAKALVQLLRRDDQDHICILVDQFEELFAFSRQYGSSEARLYTQILVGLIENRPAGLYAIITMRSEFLGACAQFQGFAEAVNQTQYLLPQMQFADLMRAIREPALLYNGEISYDLAAKLISETSGGQDHLPLIQHGLMLLHRQHVFSKSASEASHEVGEPKPWQLTLEYYQRNNGLAGLLSDHADQVCEKISAQLADLKDIKAIIAELFRALTGIDADGNAIRRPQTLAQLSAVTTADESLLTQIISFFRIDGVSFLKPYGDAPIAAEDLIDISHEALIRSWKKIAEPQHGWLSQEFEDGLIWKSLQVQADSFKRDSNNVISPATTLERSQWLKKRSVFWAQRYGGGWEQVQELISASTQAAEQVKQQEEKLFKKTAQQKYTTIGLIVAVFFILVTSMLSYVANKARNEAQIASNEAQIARDRAEANLQKFKMEMVVRKSAQEQAQQAQSTAAYTLAKTSTVPQLLSEISMTEDPYEIAVLAESLVKLSDNLTEEQEKTVTSALFKALKYINDAGSMNAILQAVNVLGPIFSASSAEKIVLSLIDSLSIFEKNNNVISSLTQSLNQLIERFDEEQAQRIFWDLAKLPLSGDGNKDSKILQPIFIALASSANFPAPRLYIHIASEKQRNEAQLLKQQLEQKELLGGRLVVPRITLEKKTRRLGTVYCFSEEECQVDGADIANILHELVKKPRLKLQNQSSTAHSETIRPRHYELWFAPGDLVVKSIKDLPYVKDEITLDATLRLGSKSKEVKKLQEWLNLHGFQIAIDGLFSKTTENAVKKFQLSRKLSKDGIVSQKTYEQLIVPMTEALSPLLTKGRPFNELVAAYARQHLAQHPAEVGGANSGPWVRLYMSGNDGRQWLWQAGFVSFLLTQAADSAGITIPIKGSVSVDTLAKQAKKTGLFFSENDLLTGRFKLRPGDIFLRRRTSTDWTHAGIVTEFHIAKGNLAESTFSTIEGNTNDEGARKGYEVAARKRSISVGNYDFICIRSLDSDRKCAQ